MIDSDCYVISNWGLELNIHSLTDIKNCEYWSIISNILEIAENEDNIETRVRTIIQDHANQCTTIECKVKLASVGISSLFLFIQSNWTGPKLTCSKLPQFHNKHEQIMKELTLDGESISPSVKDVEYLLIATVILSVCCLSFEDLPFIKRWYLRSLFIHQQILEEISPLLYEKIINIINEITETVNSSASTVSRALFSLEKARIFLYFSNVQKSKLEIKNAMELLGMETELIGSLGKRTKFQQNDLAQLMFRVNLKNDADTEEIVSTVNMLPQDLNLNDEVVLDKINYVNKEDGVLPRMSPHHQAAVLGLFVQTKKSQPSDILANEELQSLLNAVLDHPQSWSLQLTALLFRSKLESNSKRTVERAMMQCDILVNSIENDEPAAGDRLREFFISYQPAKWVVESTLADLLVSLGAVKSALDIYTRLQSWEKMIACYNTLQLRHKAEEIIRKKLSVDPNPKLWCLLGDATDDFECYQKAWEMSNGKSARAQRHWALFFYNRRKFAESIPHFQKSLEINSLQTQLWYRLGYATLHEEKWEISAQAYRRYCALDSECFEAWNNMARCYCELGQKKRAWKALQEALKVNYTNWRVWDNYMIVSADLGEFDEVIRSYHQILDLQEKHVDISVLKVLVAGVIQSSLQSDEESLSIFEKLRKKCLTLFGRLTSQIINNSDLWFLYSKIPQVDNIDGLKKKQQLLMKAHRSSISKPNWEKTIECCKEVLTICSKLCDVSLKINERPILTSCKLNVTGVLVRIKKEHPGTDICDELDSVMDRINEELDK